MIQPNPINPSKLRDLIVSYFSEEELQALCMDLDIDYETIPGQTKKGKVMGLIEYVQHRSRLPELIKKLKELRPRVNWDDPRPDKDVSPKRRWLSVLVLILIVALGGALMYARSGRLCAYHAATDIETIVQIIKIESQAVKEGNLAIIEDIFAPDAYIKQTEKGSGKVTEWFDPLSHYGTLFENTKFLTAVHNNISGTVNGRSARFTSGGQGSYTQNGEYGEYDNKAGNPNEEEVWTLQKNLCGCWQITKFEFH